MSRAFVKEGDGETEDLSLLPMPTGPLRVTSATRASWRSQLDEAEARVRRLSGSEAPEDRLELAQARRHAVVLRARLDAAVVQDDSRDPEEAGFGSVVVVQDGTGRRWRFTLVGGAEAEPAAGRISWRSPLGEALIGCRRGDAVSWERRRDTVALTVIAVEPPAR